MLPGSSSACLTPPQGSSDTSHSRTSRRRQQRKSRDSQVGPRKPRSDTDSDSDSDGVLVITHTQYNLIHDTHNAPVVTDSRATQNIAEITPHPLHDTQIAPVTNSRATQNITESTTHPPENIVAVDENDTAATVNIAVNTDSHDDVRGLSDHSSNFVGEGDEDYAESSDNSDTEPAVNNEQFENHVNQAEIHEQFENHVVVTEPTENSVEDVVDTVALVDTTVVPREIVENVTVALPVAHSTPSSSNVQHVFSESESNASEFLGFDESDSFHSVHSQPTDESTLQLDTLTESSTQFDTRHPTTNTSETTTSSDSDDSRPPLRRSAREPKPRKVLTYDELGVPGLKSSTRVQKPRDSKFR